jgi:predicted KAP-like P-loop ATPase
MDDPIRSETEDLLRRREFARHLAGIVNRIGALPSSTVVGLVGPWGSGKTSVVNLMGRDLQPSWHVRRFDPWESGDVGSLIQGFFAAISSALPDDDNGRRARSILESRATAALPLLALIPYAGTAAKDVIEQLQERSRQLRSSELGLQQLGRALQDAGRKALVVIDDVDRLLPDELLSLFKAIRLLGRIPHVHYLLAYDERTLLDVLQQTAFGGEGGRRARTTSTRSSKSGWTSLPSSARRRVVSWTKGSTTCSTASASSWSRPSGTASAAPTNWSCRAR